MPFPGNIESSINLDNWLIVNGNIAEDTVETPNVGRHNPFWQLRVAIKPDRANAMRAARALSRLPQFQAPNHPTTKIYIPPAGYDIARWDGTIRGADSDQRGKEICIYMEYNPARSRPRYYEGAYPSQTHMKQLMLDIWKALQDAGVEMAYLPPPEGERAITVTNHSPTPFSYSSFKPYRQRWRILRETGYNPTHQHDPLDRLEITPQDLRQAHIQPMGVQTFIKRLREQDVHYSLRLNDVLRSMTRREETDARYTQMKLSLDIMLRNSDPVSEEEYTNFRQQVAGLGADYFPAWEGDMVDASPFGRFLAGAPEDEEGRRSALVSLQTALRVEMLQTIQDLKNALPATIPANLEIDLRDDTLEKRFHTNPLYMQKKIQRLVLLQHEKAAMERDREQFTTYVNTNIHNNQFPQAYREQIVEGDPLESVRNLLNHYTKNNSRMSRFFSGVWRHHADEVHAIVQRIGSRYDELNTVESVLNELAAIRLQNPHGALARKIDLIAKIYIESVNDNCCDMSLASPRQV